MSRSLLTALLLCTISSAAMAANTTPLRDWIVETITAKNGAARYCSLKNGYEAAQLTFARDPKGSNSIGVELAKGGLDVDQVYDVTLAVAGQTRQFTAQAASKRVLIFQMGGDKAFYEALANGGGMNLTLNGEGYAFAFPGGLGPGLNKLADCAASLNAGGKPFDKTAVTQQPQQPAVAAAEPAAAEPRLLKPSAQALFSEPPKTVLKVEMPVVAAAAVEAPKTEAPTDVAAITAGVLEKRMQQLKETQANVEKMQAENAQLSAQNQNFQRKLVEEQTLQSVQGNIDTLRNENRRLASENGEFRRKMTEQEDLKARLAALETRTQQNTQIDAQNERARLELDRTRLELQQRMAAMQKASAEALDRLTADNERLKNENLENQRRYSQQSSQLQARLDRQEKQVRTQEEKAESLADIQPSSGGAVQIISAPATQSWKSDDDIYASAQQVQWPEGKSFDAMAADFIASAATRCDGEFQQTMGEAKNEGGRQIQEAEMACFGGAQDVVATVLFIGSNGKFTATVQEGTQDQLPALISKRESLVKDQRS